MLEGAGFAVTTLDDITEEAIGWATPNGPPKPCGASAAMIVGARIAEMAGNFVRNLREGRVHLVVGLAEAT